MMLASTNRLIPGDRKLWIDLENDALLNIPEILKHVLCLLSLLSPMPRGPYSELTQMTGQPGPNER
jgi:hypothetical protein